MRPQFAQAAADLRRDLENADPDAFAQALAREVARRNAAVLDGIEAYRQHPYSRDLPDPPVVWEEGTTRLLDYGGAPEATDPLGPPILFIPSLINRSYVLDLSGEISLLRWLAARGFRPLLVDWDRPGPDERAFGLTEYVAGRLEAALDAALDEAGQRMPAVGYCMGGTLAVGLAHRRQRDLTGLCLMATPWDFHADQGAQARLLARSMLPFAGIVDALGEMPTDFIQVLFTALDPQLAARKFAAFARLPQDTPKARAFVALEDWLNDGVPLAAPVARECIFDWYGQNATANANWRVAGRLVNPAEVEIPALSLIPANDRIVPPASSQTLADLLPAGQDFQPPLGHIGMVVSGGAQKGVWELMAEWLAEPGRSLNV
ncbi:MAG: alpha/beta fold hydrolase [Rhodovibrionaceae bacterium]|nr:alpha/beta fold hydrolase [Rhodovibrionaceae bacterium]